MKKWSEEKERLEVEKLQVEIEKIKSEKQNIEIERRAKELEVADLARDDANISAAANTNRVYNFIGSVNGQSVKDCMLTLGRWTRRDPGQPITLIFNSPGGSVIDGLALYDDLLALRTDRDTHIVTIARGMAASMGGILLQAGDERVMGKNAHLLIHEVSSLGIGKLSEMEDELQFCKKLQSRLLEILAERSTLTTKQIERRWKRKDWWLNADETLELGFADRIG